MALKFFESRILLGKIRLLACLILFSLATGWGRRLRLSGSNYCVLDWQTKIPPVRVQIVRRVIDLPGRRRVPPFVRIREWVNLRSTFQTLSFLHLEKRLLQTMRWEWR